MADRTPDLDAERAATELRNDPDFAPIRASFLAMIRCDLPPGIIDLSLIEADPDTAFFLLMKVTTDATRQGKPDPARVFLSVWGSMATLPVAVRAQEPGRVYRIGSLHQSPRDAPHHVAFFAELRKSGFVEGRNLIADKRGYGMRAEQFSELAREHAKYGVDVMLCGGEAAGEAAQTATTAIPIVVLADDMIRAGLVPLLQKPGGNTTGVSILATELDGKRQEILMEAVPNARHIAALTDPASATVAQLEPHKIAAHARGMELSIHTIAKRSEIAPAIDAAKASGASALNVLASALFFNNRQVIYQRVAELRLPTIYQWPEMADQDGLLGYGPSIVQIYRDITAGQLVKTLRGINPADIPVEQPTRFEFVVNLKAAKAIGFEIPANLVLRADRVIE